MTILFWLTLFWIQRDFSPRHPLFGPGFIDFALWSPFNLGLPPLLWAFFAFAFGQTCTLLSRRILVASFLALVTSLFILAFWLPSLIFGGVRVWQIAVVPLILLGAARISMWIWFSGGFYTRRHLLVLGGTALLLAGWMGGNFWYRAIQLPDVGEPFDIRAFEAKLDRAVQNPAVELMREGERRLVERQAKAYLKVGPLTEYLYLSHQRRRRSPNTLREVITC